MNRHDLTLRPITGPGELDLFNRLPYVLDDEVADDLAAGGGLCPGRLRHLRATDRHDVAMTQVAAGLLVAAFGIKGSVPARTGQ